jgi:Tol biopolymer transport system component
MSKLAALGVVVTVVIVVSAAQARQGAFPGANGLIAFNSEGSVYVVKPDGSGLRQIANTNSEDFTTGVSWSADGLHVAFSAYKGSDPDVYVVDASGRHLRQVTFSRGVDVDPSWSPDGTRIAFESNRNGGQVDIYSVDSHGRNPKRLTDAPENEQDPSWSPDGKRIAYTVESTDHLTRQVWVMNADGSGKTQLTSTPNFSENPNWSPDGSRIAFDSDRVEKGDLDIWTMRPDGSDVKRITSTPALDALPAYSPDGKQLVFVSDRLQKDSRRLFVMPSSGGRPRRLIAADAPAFQMVPDWQRVRTGTLQPAATLPGGALAVRGVSDSVDPLYDLDDAWAVKMESGVTYRINYSTAHGCATEALYAPHAQSFADHAILTRACGGYATYTPGPGRSGTYTIRVAAVPNTEPIVSYHLQVASAEQDDQGPGLLMSGDETRRGSVSGRSVDDVDLFHFVVHDPSVVKLSLQSAAALSLRLTSLTGKQIAAGATIVERLRPGTYLAQVSAPGRAAGAYALSVLVRVVTKTTLTLASTKLSLGDSVALQTATAPAPAGGRVGLRLDYDDPLSGWVFRKLWFVAPGGGVTFTPPTVGLWRVTASFYGTRNASPSHSKTVEVDVR